MRMNTPRATTVATCVVLATVLAGIGGCDREMNVDEEGRSARSADNMPPVPDDPPYAKAVVDEAIFDFGIMQEGERGEHTFVIKNEATDRDLVLKKGPSSCKCTISDLKDNRLKPGESAKIVLTWTIPPDQPRFSQTAEIWTSDPEQRVIELTVRGEVHKPIMISPKGVWVAGLLEDGKPKTISGHVGSAIHEDFKIVSVKPTSLKDPKQSPKRSKVDGLLQEVWKLPWGTMAIVVKPISEEMLKRLRGKTGFEVVVTVTPMSHSGYISEPITIAIESTSKDNNQPEISQFPIKIVGTASGPVIVRAAPRVRWNPNRFSLSLGQFSASKGISEELLLFVAEPQDTPFKITGAEADPKFLTWKLVSLQEEGKKPEPGARTRYKLQLSVPPGSQPLSRRGKNAATITLKTSHPKVPELKIRVEFHSN